MKKRHSAKSPASPLWANVGFFSFPTVSKFLKIGIPVLATILAIHFLFRPFSLLSTESETFPRGLFFLLPFVDPEFYLNRGLGDWATWSWDQKRTIIMEMGGMALLTLLFTGRILLAIIKISPLILLKGASRSCGRLTGGEKLFFSYALGFAFWSTVIAWCGFFGAGWNSSFFPLSLLILFKLGVCYYSVALGCFLLRRKTDSEKTDILRQEAKSGLVFSGVLLLILLFFVILYSLAGTVPPFEYDALEYHFQGAREFFEAGRIGFVDHNAYLNMPLGTEMIYVWSALATPLSSHYSDLGGGGGEILLYSFCAAKFLIGLAPIFVALGLYSFVRRFWGSGKMGLVAALCYLAFPDNFQVFANGLNDGMVGLFLFATLDALFILTVAFHSEKKGDDSSGALSGLIVLGGITAGFATACKFTAVPFILIPASVALLFLLGRQGGTVGTKLGRTLLFLSAVALFGGGWYAKNLYYSGNPFWPLGWNLFGDRTGIWDAAKNVRWSAAHSAHDFWPSTFFSDLGRFAFLDDFASMFLAVFGFFLVALLVVFWGRFRRDHSFSTKGFLLITGYSLFFILLWWWGTHRLLRFLVPLLPLLAILLAVTFVRLTSWTPRGARFFLYALLLTGGGYSISLNVATTGGLLVPYRTLLSDANRYGDWAVWLNRGRTPISKDASDSPQKLLLVGEARGFAFYSDSILVNTCWDDSQLVKILPERLRAERKKRKERGATDDWRPSFDWTSDETADIRARLAAEKIAWILVDYAEIERFLSPGNYGLTDKEFMTPEFFTSLERAGILKVYRPEDFDNFSERSQKSVLFYQVIP